jgi:hypothetical protein
MGAVADRILTSRLLVLQSKRLLLATAETILVVKATGEAQSAVQRRLGEVRRAQGLYNDAVLRWGEPVSPQYRIVAYSSLVAKAERLREVLRSAAPHFAHSDRSELLADADNLGMIIQSWSEVLRNAMAEVA